ncbi:MAG TPA: response regulator [Dongiaceae bacterium]|nr:response regulator [Dongiaceae bacterium]
MPTEPSDHILIVDDDREIRDLLSRFMAKHGYRVSTAADGREMRRIMADARIDLIVLDVMMPGETGLTLCGQVRATSKVPIIMLTAVAEDTDRIIGLELGADDYLAKPFNPRELLARIRAVLRRSDMREPVAAAESEVGAVLSFASWKLDLGTRQLTNPVGEAVELSTGEYDLLVAFAERPQRVLSRDRLLDLAKGRAAVAFDRSIDVQVGRLRRKIEVDASSPQLITTVRGGGYMFTPQVTRS